TNLQNLVDQAIDVLCDRHEPLYRLGDLLHEGWILKRSLAEGVTNPHIDRIYDAAMAAGATGGKLLGAGGGGFMVFIARPERQMDVRKALEGLVQVTVDIDRDGSRIMLYEPDGLGRQ